MLNTLVESSPPTTGERRIRGLGMGRSMTVVEPVILMRSEFEIEIAVHRPNPSLRRELELFLRGAIGSENSSLKNAADVFVITTCQESKTELLQWDEEAAAEKDKLLLRFNQFSTGVCEQLRAAGFWADFADPASGLLANSPGQVIWPEVQALERLRGFQKIKAGPCHIILHPKWGSRVYPATMFTNAPEDVVRGAFGI